MLSLRFIYVLAEDNLYTEVCPPVFMSCVRVCIGMKLTKKQMNGL